MNAYQNFFRNPNRLFGSVPCIFVLCTLCIGFAFQAGYAQAPIEDTTEAIAPASPPTIQQDTALAVNETPRTVILLPLLAYQGQLEWNPLDGENTPLVLNPAQSMFNPENAGRMWNQLYTKISLKRSSFRPFHPDTLINWMKIWKKEETGAPSLKAWIQQQSGAELEFVWQDIPMVSTVSRHSWYLFFMGKRVSKRHLTLQWNLPDGGIAFRDTLYAADTVATGFCGFIECEFLPLSAKERRDIDLRLEEKLLRAFDVSTDRFLNPAKYDTTSTDSLGSESESGGEVQNQLESEAPASEGSADTSPTPNENQAAPETENQEEADTQN